MRKRLKTKGIWLKGKHNPETDNSQKPTNAKNYSELPKSIETYKASRSVNKIHKAVWSNNAKTK